MKWHMFIGLLISGIKVFYEGGVIMSKVNMSNLILFLCASSKIPTIVFAHHTTAEGCTKLCKLIKETYDNEEKYGSSHT